MAGTSAGALKGIKTKRRMYGRRYFRQVASLAGKQSHTGGFAANPDLAREAGRKGGLVSKRGPAIEAVV